MKTVLSIAVILLIVGIVLAFADALGWLS